MIGDPLPLRVVIVCRHPLCRAALAALAAEELHADVVDVWSGVPEVGADGADLLLIDLPSSEVPAAWIELAPKAAHRVLVVPKRDLALARLAYAAGFNGLLPENSERPLMVAILKLILAGGEYFPCFDEASASGAPVLLRELSPRQREVLNHLTQGQTNKEIAKRLGVSIATVKLHVQAILSATGARNRTEVVSRLGQTAP